MLSDLSNEELIELRRSSPINSRAYRTVCAEIVRRYEQIPDENLFKDFLGYGMIIL
jgi:hypothetical protein